MDIESEIQDKARSLGFDLCGIARVRTLAVDRGRFDRWIGSGYHSTLGYMCRNTDKRFDPTLLVPGARSVIVCAASYNRGLGPQHAGTAADMPGAPLAAGPDNRPLAYGRTHPPHSAVDRDDSLPASACGNTPSAPVQNDLPHASDRTPVPHTETHPPAEIAGRDSADPGHRPRIASYALTRDYHLLIRERLQELCEFIRSLDPSFEGRPFVDTAPLLEKRWAVEAGLGWIGRNSLFINRRYGSWLMLGEIVTTLNLRPTPVDAIPGTTPDSMPGDDILPAPGHPHENTHSNPNESPHGDPPDNPLPAPDARTIGDTMCGSCRRCIEACPNGAIVSPMVIDTRRCISRITVESKYTGEGDYAPAPEGPATGSAARTPEGPSGTVDHPSAEASGTSPHPLSHAGTPPSLHGWIFGCDECQLCCPYNMKAEISPCNLFTSRPAFLPPTAGEWLAMTQEEFDTRFGDTPLCRCGLGSIQQKCRLANTRQKTDETSRK